MILFPLRQSPIQSFINPMGETLDSIKADDVTVSIIREAKPAGLFQYFKEHGYSISSPCRGIYYIEGPFPFPAQIVATGELEEKSHTWLRALSKRMDRESLRNLLEKISQITEKNDREMANSILEVSIEANRKMIEGLMGDDSMFETLMEIMEPKIDEIRKEERKEGIQSTINILRRLKHNDPEIKSEIMKQYQLTEEEASVYLHP